MANVTGSQGLPTNESAEQTQENSANFIIGIVLLVSAFVGCSLAVLALGRDFFIGKNPPVVFVGALVWVDFIGLFSTVVLVFQGFVKGEEWIAKSPQCSLQVCKYDKRAQFVFALFRCFFYYFFKVFFFFSNGSSLFFLLSFNSIPRAVSIRCKILRICFSSVLIKNKQTIIIPRGYSRKRFVITVALF